MGKTKCKSARFYRVFVVVARNGVLFFFCWRWDYNKTPNLKYFSSENKSTSANCSLTCSLVVVVSFVVVGNKRFPSFYSLSQEESEIPFDCVCVYRNKVILMCRKAKRFALLCMYNLLNAFYLQINVNAIRYSSCDVSSNTIFISHTLSWHRFWFCEGVSEWMSKRFNIVPIWGLIACNLYSKISLLRRYVRS